MKESEKVSLQEGNLLIGWSEVSITPKKPVKIQGQFHERISKYVQSECLATVLAVETIDDEGNSIEQMMICSCDLTTVAVHLIKAVREKLKGKLEGFDLSKLFLCATHTHSSPLTSEDDTTDALIKRFIPKDRYPLSPAEGIDIMQPHEYKEFLIKQISHAFMQAWQNRKIGAVSCEYAQAVIGHNRRVVYNDKSALMYGKCSRKDFFELEGGVDHGIELLYFWDSDKNLTGTSINVSCPSQVLESKYFISADYWGEARRILKEKLGDYMHILPLCGAAGDISPRDLVRAGRCEPDMHEIEGAQELGERVANAVISKINTNTLKLSKVIFKHSALKINLPIRTVTQNECIKAKEEIEKILSEQNENERFTTNMVSTIHIPGGILDRYEYQARSFLYNCEYHFIRLGDIAIATNPFELFTNYGLRIKAWCRAQQTFIIQQSCDRGKYLPTQKAIDGGHYSAIVASGIVGPTGGEYLVKQTVDILNEMW